MRIFHFGLSSISVLGLSLGLMAFSGCGQSGDSDQGSVSDSAAAADVHDHPSEGPHHGELVELGVEDYHLEMVHDDDAGSVTVYVLDSSAKLAVAIEAAEIVVNLSHDGEAEQFVLAASSEPNDPEGKSSRFVSTEDELAEDLDHAEGGAQIVVNIEGKQYRGTIHHDHDEHGHDDHDEDDNHEH